VAKLKVFVADDGFYEAAVAAPSMKAALAAWGFTHNAFAQGFAHKTDDQAAVTAALEKPGVVVRRPLGTRGAFKREPDLPKIKGSKPAKARKRRVDRGALSAAKKALASAEREHRRQAERFAEERARIDREERQERADFEELKTRLDAAITEAKKPR
jgi:hypothetical protein